MCAILNRHVKEGVAIPCGYGIFHKTCLEKYGSLHVLLPAHSGVRDSVVHCLSAMVSLLIQPQEGAKVKHLQILHQIILSKLTCALYSDCELKRVFFTPKSGLFSH